MMADPAARRSRNWSRFVAIVALYGLLGPLVGALGVNALFTLLAIGGEVAQGRFGDLVRLLVGGLVVGMIYSTIVAYALGSASAVAVGLAVAIGDRSQGRISWMIALGSALVLWLVATALTLFVADEGRVQWIGAMLVAHLLAAAICTWMAARIFR